MTGKVQDSKVM